ncbi:MAG: hypothetical protein IJZ92_05090 [Bacteroidaceae bacterium]|nr:hypothetical protein [Bacteroidaceae bacterium]
MKARSSAAGFFLYAFAGILLPSQEKWQALPKKWHALPLFWQGLSLFIKAHLLNRYGAYESYKVRSIIIKIVINIFKQR